MSTVKPTDLTGPEPFVTTREVALFLGKPESWIYNNAERRGLPRHQLGLQYRYRLSEVSAWVDAQDLT